MAAVAVFSLGLTGVAFAQKWKGDSGSVMLFTATSSGFSLDEEESGRLPVLDGTVRRLVAGVPDLPYWVRMVPLERGTKLRLLSEQSRVTDFGTVMIAPVPTHKLDPYDPESGRLIAERIEDPDVYSRDAWWPASLVEITEAKQGTQRWARVVINLFQYQPKSGALRVHDDVTLELVAVPETAQYP